MSDFNSELPVRSSLPGQVNADDIIIKLGDATNPATQQASVDTFGSQSSILKDVSGNAIGDQLLNATYWLQVVNPSNGPAAPGTASASSTLAGGIFNSTPPTLTNGQQSALQLDVNGRLLVDTSNTDDHNYGVVGASTLRTAAQIGNATGAADFNAGATGAQTLRVEANQGAPGLAANAWFTKITDGTNTASVSATGELSAIITEPLPAGTNNIGSVNQGTSPWVISGTVTANQGTSPWVTSATQSGTWTVGLSEDHNWGVVGSNTLRTAAEIGNATGAADFNFGVVGAQTLRVASEIGNATGAADFNNGATGAQTLRVAANLAVAGANVSNTNPVPVFISNSVPGAEVLDYLTHVALAAGASNTHTYTVPGGETFTLQQVEAAASGKIKVVIQINGATKVVMFNSSANPNVDYIFQAPQLVAAAGTVSVIITNLDNQAQDVYSTIEGVNNP